MLLDKIKETTELIRECETAKDQSKRKQEYDDLKSYIKPNVPKVKAFKTSLECLSRYDGEKFQKVDVSKSIRLIDELNDKILSGVPVNKSNIKFVFEDVSGKSLKLKEVWKHYVELQTQHLKNTLQCFKGLFEDKTKINAIIGGIDSMSSRWPITQRDLEELDDLIKGCHEVIDNLEATQDVQDFLKMVILGTATLNDLTPEILDWIKRKKFTSILSIQFKG